MKTKKKPKKEKSLKLNMTFAEAIKRIIKIKPVKKLKN